MIQTTHFSKEPIGGIISHYVKAYDENCELIDIVVLRERKGRIFECRSILD